MGLSTPDASDDVCIAQGFAQASLRFRSPVHRAFRAVGMLLPLFLGLTHEYQTVQVELLSYSATARQDGRLPLLDGIRVEISTDRLQVAEATVTLRVRRRSFLMMMLKERKMSRFVVVSVVIWYCLLVWVALVVAVVSAVLAALLRARGQYGVEDEEVREEGEGTEDSKQSVGGMVSAALPPRFGEAGSSGGRTVASALTSGSGASSINDTRVRRRGEVLKDKYG